MIYLKILVGLFSGIVSGMFSSGGGLILIPAYTFLFNSSERESKSTAVFCILPMVITSTIFYGFNNYINWKVALLCALGGVIGGWIGSKLLNTLKPKYLKIIFIIFLLYSGIRITFF